jgi:hypothetical protein
MAVIATTSQKAEVQALGSAMDATVNFNGALMEMLATVYIYIMMAAIREAIQNGADAARRAGLSFAEGVLVELPTASNRMITIIDKGSGMTKDFMENDYLSFGSSTKSGDNGAAGGLGVGRWAAYGYIRECYITTCHESEMVSRTYFQFQAANGKPQVQLASEVPGTVVGTRVTFPIKESDHDEALRAVAWLKEVMQLTMGDSFSVDTPAVLPTVLPKFNGTAITLEEVDAGLAGVRIYPMQGKNLKYGRQGLQDGSLVVLANQEAGVGGLPFHVQSPAGDESVFKNGMVVEIPMSFNIPFMPSREEIKYTDEVNALLKRIDEAAGRAIVAKAAELYSSPSLAAKAQLSELLGNESAEDWHWFARATRSHANPVSPLKEQLSKATGGRAWMGSMQIPMVAEMRTEGMTIKSTDAYDTTLRSAFSNGGNLSISGGPKVGPVSVTFHPNRPVALVVNDLKTGGTARFRNWLKLLPSKGHLSQKFVYLSSEVLGEAQDAANALNSVFGGALEVHHTSRMPAVARMVVGSAVVAARTRGSSLTYFSRSENKQVTESMGFATYDSRETRRVWLCKDGSRLAGFKADVTLASLAERWGEGNLLNVLAALKIDKLYLLTTKQAGELAKMRAETQADGLWDMADDDFADDEEGREALGAVKALKTWKCLEDVLAEMMDRKAIQDTLDGRKVHTVKESWEFNQFLQVLAKRPRMELTGTRLDKALAPHLDLLSCNVTVHLSKDMNAEFKQLIAGIALVGFSLDEAAAASDERNEMIANMRKLRTVGSINYELVFQQLREQFPMLAAMGKLNTATDVGVDHLCQALAVVYR